MEDLDATMRVFNFIRDFLALNSWAPSQREIAEACDYAFPSAVHRHLVRLAALGLIEWQPGKARAIALTAAGTMWHWDFDN